MNRIQTTTEKHIYKYLSINEYSLDCLRNNHLFFANPVDFNDPLEFSIKLKLIKDSQAEKDWIKNLNLSEKENQLVDLLKIRDQLSIGLEPKFKEELSKQVGVTCFSENSNNFLLWSHYADKHQGICLKFDWRIHSDFFQGAKVDYVEEFPEIPYSSSEGFQEQIPKIVTTKLKIWEYENEIRAVAPFTENQSRILKFNPEALVGVIFGEKTNEKNIEIVRGIINSHHDYGKVSFYKAQTQHRESSLLTINLLE